MNYTIKGYFETVTPESAEDGDFADSGEYEHASPDQDDLEDQAVTDWAVDYLIREGVIHASSSSFHVGIGYLTGSSVQNYRTGEEISYSFHLDGFSEVEQREVYDSLKARLKARHITL
jgi:hypothetical protein